MPRQQPVGKWFVGTPATEAKRRKKHEAEASKKKPEKSRIRKPRSRTQPRRALASDNSISASGSGQIAVMELSSDVEEAGGALDVEDEIDEGLELVLRSSDREDGDQLPSDDDDKQDIRPLKRAKTQVSPARSNSPEIEITAYVEVITPPRTLKAKPVSATRGPFFFTLDYTYVRFLQAIASCAAADGHGIAAVAAINKSQLSWKLSVPANDRKKPLSDEFGFRALVKKVRELAVRKKDCSVIVMLPPLSKVANSVSSRNPTVQCYVLIPYYSLQIHGVGPAALILKWKNFKKDLWVQRSGSKRRV